MDRLSWKTVTQFVLVLAAVYLCISYLPAIMTFAAAVWQAASPLVMGCMIAYILNILLVRLERWYFPHSKKPMVQKTRRLVCVVLAFVVLLTMLLLVLNVVLPEVISSLTLIAQEIPRVWEETRIWLIAHADYIPMVQQYLQQMDFDWAASLKKTLDTVANSAGNMLNSVVGIATSALGFLAKFVIGLIFALYLLFGKEQLSAQGLKILSAYLKPEKKEKVLHILHTLHVSFSNFIVGQCTEAVILGCLCALGMAVLRLPYAVMTGTIIGVSALIPVAGAYIGGALGAFMIFTVAPTKVVIFLIFLVLLQQVEGNLIYPRVVGNSIGLPGLWVLAAVTIGGSLLGIGGMLIGVPLSAALYKLFAEQVQQKLQTK